MSQEQSNMVWLIWHDSWSHWNTQACPTVVPIPKPVKEPFEPSNYRLIALTTCWCKMLEQMINSTLIWYLESNNLLTPFQCGFCKGGSTIDHIVRLETFIRETVIQHQHMVAVFFDMGKAYDTTWKYGIEGSAWNRPQGKPANVCWKLTESGMSIVGQNLTFT